MRNILLTIQYDGGNYKGWQMQNSEPTAEREVTNAVSRLTGENIKLYGSGRTDAGVHAFGQCANFKTDADIKLDKFITGTNAFMAEDIKIINAQEMTENFHARYHSLKKEYIYLIYNSKVMNPVLRDKAAHVFYDIDIDKMQQAAKLVIGKHDFKGFAGRNNAKEITNRTVFKSEIEKIDENLMIYKIEGDGFLHNMVRIIVGSLIDTGRGKFKTDRISEVLDTGDRELAKLTAAAHGLYLNKVYYDDKYYL